MPILDGHTNAEVLPEEQREYVNAYGDALAASAVKMQRKHGYAIRDLLGVIVNAGDEEETAGVAVLAEVLPELLESVGDAHRENIQRFLLRNAPPTHLRSVVWTAVGVGLFRVDVVPPGQTGIEA